MVQRSQEQHINAMISNSETYFCPSKSGLIITSLNQNLQYTKTSIYV